MGTIYCMQCGLLFLLGVAGDNENTKNLMGRCMRMKKNRYQAFPSQGFMRSCTATVLIRFP